MQKKRRTLSKVRPSTIITITIIVAILSLSLGYASFSSVIDIEDIYALVRLNRDIRITNVSVASASNNGLSTYEEYNRNALFFGVNLPNEDSTVTYKVKVTNFGNARESIFAIKGLPDNLTYELTDYKLKEKICDTTGNCRSGVEKYFDITIKYKENGYNQVLDYNIALELDFQPVFIVTLNANNNQEKQEKEVILTDQYGELYTPTYPGYEFKGWYYQGEKIEKNTIVRVEEDHELIAKWTPKKYRIAVTGNNFENKQVEIGYGGTNTVKIKPEEGYYLSSISCSTGYEASGYNTGFKETGEQTITLTNKKQDGNGTCNVQMGALKPTCKWGKIDHIRTNETTNLPLTCTSPVAFTSTNLSTSQLISSNIDIGKVTGVKLVNATTNDASYNVEIKGIKYGSFNVTMNASALKAPNGTGNDKITSDHIKVVDFEVNSENVSLNLTTTNTFQIQVIGGNYGSVSYTSDNPNIATVSSSGLIRSKASGTANITVKENTYGYTKQIKVSVTNNLVVNYALTYLKSSNMNTTITHGQTYTTVLTPINKLVYGRPKNLSIYMGSTLLSASKYTYNSVTGDLSIPNVTSDLRIVGIADVLSGENISFATAQETNYGNLGTVSCTQKQQIRAFKFVPKESGSYTFWSNDPIATERKVDPYAYLYELSDTVTIAALDKAAETYADTGSYTALQNLSIAYNDDGGAGYNFKITRNLVAGKTYYLAIRTFNVTLIQSFTNVMITKN